MQRGAVEALNPAMLVALGEAGIKTLDDLGDLASDELREIVGEGAIDEVVADKVIMSARAHWFPDEPAGQDETAQAEEAPSTASGE